MVNSGSITICHLFEQPQHVKAVAGWIHREWWSQRPGHTEATMELRLRQACSPDRVPLSLLAMEGCTPIGTVNLVENDAEQRPDWTPWLAALLVLPDYRGRGTGTDLVKRLLRYASRLEIKELYLGTDIPSFYNRFGSVDLEVFPNGFRYMTLPVPP
ncbi:MAG TPA: GNAT family N-acetyltransferase [Thermoanaerobaculia bacterium]|nr:GNAT family N-acetyltransferase [Thermoanaerobaculia bacterium]HUM29843.1 GNAT family N-acetyltransferase [Thermoanaerobaculia bacterium]HXK68118.1 GNAT family N-acetyltransferase [Thermoanaerobaculia bacterium]